MSKLSEEIRKNFGENDKKRDFGLDTPDSIVRFDNILYGEDSYWQKLDVYRPKNLTGSLPVIVSVHGGGWVYGDKELYQYYCMSLAEKGFVVVNFSYRLAPEYKFPAPIQDTINVFTWIRQHANEYNMDINNVFAVGDSAGANILCNFLGILINVNYKDKMFLQYDVKSPDMIYTQAQYDRLEDRPADCLIIKAVALNCGVYIIEGEQLNGYMIDYLDKKDAAAVSMLEIAPVVTEDFPASYLMTGTEDFLRYQPSLMTRALTDNSVPFVYHMYGDSKNRLTHVFHCDIKSKYAKICNEDECNFFKSFI